MTVVVRYSSFLPPPRQLFLPPPNSVKSPQGGSHFLLTNQPFLFFVTLSLRHLISATNRVLHNMPLHSLWNSKSDFKGLSNSPVQGSGLAGVIQEVTSHTSAQPCSSSLHTSSSHAKQQWWDCRMSYSSSAPHMLPIKETKTTISRTCWFYCLAPILNFLLI